MTIFENNNIILALLAILPTLGYAWMAIKRSGSKTINPKTCFMHMMLGAFSGCLLLLYQFVFPSWDAKVFADHAIFSMAIFAYLQVALVEESSKLGTFLLGDDIRREQGPVDSMLYMMFVGCGFAIAENLVTYFPAFGYSAIIPRATSVLIHISCALVIGYFLNIGRVLGSGKWTSRLGFPTIGVSLAVLYHGTFNFSLMLGDSRSWMRMLLLLILAFCAGWFVIDDLRRRIR